MVPALIALVSLFVAVVPLGEEVPDSATVAAGNNGFAADLFARLRESKGNLAFSPASLSTALAMTYAGARGETAQEMARTLHFTLKPERLHPAFGKWMNELNGPGDRPYELAVANALWANEGESLTPEFLKIQADHYGAGLRTINFRSPDARRIINQWVAEHTAGKIPDLLQPPHPAPDTSLALTNAVYFKGDWQEPFSRERTKEEPFHLEAGQEAKVAMMHATRRLPYFKGDGWAAIEMPYAGGDLSMLVLLPDEVGGLSNLEKQVNANILSRIRGDQKTRMVEVSLPRFRVEAAIELQDVFSAMGMPLAFRPEADFSGIDGTKGLYLSAVIHKAYVDVKEEGTEAAAATAVLATRAAAIRPEPPVVFQADRPFLFLILHRPSAAILFLGRVADPRG